MANVLPIPEPRGGGEEGGEAGCLTWGEGGCGGLELLANRYCTNKQSSSNTNKILASLPRTGFQIGFEEIELHCV